MADASVPSLLQRAGQLNELGRTEEAIALYEQAIVLEPENPNVVMNLSAALTGINNKRADELGRKAVAMAPSNTHACLVAAWAAKQANKHKDAIGFAEQAVALSPSSAETHRSLALLLCWQTTRKRPRRESIARARASSEEAIRLNPQSAWVWHAAANVALYDDEKDEARSHYMQALNVDPHFALAERGLADLNHTQARPASALAILQYMVRNDPTNARTKRAFDEVLDDVVTDIMWAAIALAVVLTILVIIMQIILG